VEAIKTSATAARLKCVVIHPQRHDLSRLDVSGFTDCQLLLLMAEIGGPGRIRTYNQQIMRLKAPAESKGFIDPPSANRGKVRQNTQTGRKRDGAQ
jgi:hypothetical protein